MSFQVREILEWVSAEAVNLSELNKDLSTVRIEKLAALKTATPVDLSFYFDSHFHAELKSAAPGVLITSSSFIEEIRAENPGLFSSTVILVAADPYVALAKTTRHFAESVPSLSHLRSDIHPSAVIAKNAQLHPSVKVGAQVVIEEGCEIGEGTVIFPHCYLGKNVKIGKHTTLFPQVTVYENCRIGSRVRIHSGVVIGADGFGYATEKSPTHVQHHKIYHFGEVIIEDEVEIGANSCIDRATFGATILRRQVKIDNLVQIAHNCEVGEGSILCGKVGLAGSVKIGRFVYIGGNTGVNNKVSVGDAARIGGCSVVVHDVPPGGILWGIPGRLGRDTFRLQVLFDRMLENNRKKTAKFAKKAKKENIDESADQSQPHGS